MAIVHLIIFTVLFRAGISLEQPKVTITQGTLQGKYLKTISDRQITAFFGIPFAKPPVGDLRFHEPVEPAPWIGSLNAVRVPPECLQYKQFADNRGNRISGSEDCLYLNVFIPVTVDKHENKPLDVLVFIHGGAFMFFSCSYFGPEYILDRDVILVTINYRLGILGFLSTEDTVLPGNNGLKDQQMALKWVQKNIRAFGGDPNKVTISGMSAGAASAHYQVLSKSSKGLFQRAIILSGSALCHWAQCENSKKKAETIATELGCPISNSEKLVECLKTRTADHIVGLAGLFQPWLYHPFTPFGPVIEPPHPGAFIDRPVSEIIQKKLGSDVPMIFSLSVNEGVYPGAEILADPKKVQYLRDNWSELIPHLLDFNFTAPLNIHATLSEKIKNKYMGKDFKNDFNSALFELLSKRTFDMPLSQSARLHANHQNSPVYAMMFSYKGESFVAQLFNLPREVYSGSGHGDDLFYVLRSHLLPFDGNRKALNMSKRLIDLWMNFITGAPFTENWQPLRGGDSPYIYLLVKSPDIADDIIVQDLDFGHVEFWNSLNLNEDLGIDKHHDEL